MAEQLLKNTCFHEIRNIDDIPEGSARIVSLNGNDATMHTRPADAGDFDTEILPGARLFLITSYNEDKEVIGAAAVADGANEENKVADGANEEKRVADGANGANEENKVADIIPAPTEGDRTVGGKRTRRRKNHGSKRRNASNKSGRRALNKSGRHASKQSRRRGKKQSKRHGRK